MQELPQNLLCDVNKYIHEDTFSCIDEFAIREDNFKSWIVAKLKPYYVLADQDVC